MGDNQKQQKKLHEKQTEIGAGAAHTITHDFRQNHTQRRPARQTITSPTSSPLSPQPPTTPTPPSAGVPPLNPNEITAEWTVRAHLTFARAGEKVQREFNSSDPLNPVRVVYKWSTVDTASNDGRDDETASTATIQSHKQQYGASRPTTPSKFSRPQQTVPSQFPDNASFRSTNSSLNADYGDSAFSSSNTSKSKQAPPHGSGSASASLYGTRCRSTCNIIVSAVADFLPADSMTSSSAANERDNYMQAHATTQREYVSVPGGEEPDPFVFNTTASYTVLPERPLDGHRGGSKNMTNFGKILALRDAYSQTSDTETKFFRDQHSLGSSRSPTYERQHNRQYDHRRATTEAVLRPPEANNFMPSYTPSPTQTFKSASLPRIPPLPGQQYGSKPAPTTATSEGQKKPRTVHIDVYCTGSEDEDDDDNADGESSSSGDSEHAGSKQHDLESNSTPQTVLDNEQMLLRHQRIAGRTLPRRLAPPPPTQQAGSQASPSQDSGLNLGHAITKSSTAEEVTESKQLLFRKHIGDQRAAKLATLRQKYIRQASDDALSSNYPNSSRSTMRDATCSSISSAVPSTHAADYADSSWKETEDFDETSFGLNKSESFEYENALDRLRIRQMENVWSRDDDDSMAARGGDCVDSGGASHMMQHMQRVTHSPTPFHMLQTISEDSSQRDSPLRLPQQQQQAQFQRNDTLPSESDVFSESDHYHTYPGRYAGALPHFQRHLQSANDAATPYLQQTAHFSRNRPGFLQFFGPEATHAPNGVNVPASAPVTTSTADPLQFPSSYQQPATAPPPPQLQRWKSEARENLTGNGAAAQAQLLQPQATMLRAGSEVPQSSTSASTFSTAMVGRRFDMKIQSPVPSDTSTAISGYTTEYLEKARVFGKVVAARKPGHHVGPTKNPSCSCDSCQRWLAERFQIRGRAFSLGERRPSLNRTN